MDNWRDTFKKFIEPYRFYMRVLSSNPFKDNAPLADWITGKGRGLAEYLVLRVNQEIGLPYLDYEFIAILKSPYLKMRKRGFVLLLIYWPVIFTLYGMFRTSDIYGIFIEASILYTVICICIITANGIMAYISLLLNSPKPIWLFFGIAGLAFGIYQQKLFMYIDTVRPYVEPSLIDIPKIVLLCIIVTIINGLLGHVVNMIFINLLRGRLRARR